MPEASVPDPILDAKLWRAVMRALPDCLVLYSPDGTLLELNPGGCALLEADSVAQLAGRPLSEFVVPEHRQAWLDLGVKAVNGQEGALEFDIITLKGTRRTLESRRIPLRDQDGRIVGILGIARDRTGLAAARAEAGGLRRRLDSLMATVPDPIVIIDPKTRLIEEVNAAFCRRFGYEAREILGKPAASISGEPEATAEGIAQAAKAGIYLVPRRLCRARDGTTFFAALFVSLYESDGENRLVGVFQDLTERDAASAAIQDEVRKLSTLIGHLPGHVFRCRNDPDWTAEFAGGQVEEIFGYPPDDLLSGRIQVGRDLIVPEHRQRVWAVVQEALSQRRPYSVEYDIRAKSGAIKTLHEKGSALYAQDGSISGLEGFVRDISDEKAAAAAIRRQQELLQILIEASPSAVAMFDPEMRYLYVSRSWKNAYRLPDDDLIGRSHYEVFPEIPERWRQVHRRCQAGAVEHSERDRFPRQDGSVDWVRWEMRPWRDASGAIGGTLLFTEVINEQVLAERKARGLERRALKLEQAAAKEFARGFLESQEAERRRIAQELHDGALQVVGAAMMHLPKSRDPGLTRAKRLLGAALKDLGRVTKDLHPAMLDLLGLKRALAALCGDCRRRTGLEVVLAWKSRRAPPADLSVMIYRTVQEGLRNCERHARARRVRVVLARSKRTWRVRIRDDGKGFDPAGLGEGLGLRGIRERSRAAGGRLRVVSKRGKGTVLDATFNER